MRVEQLWLSDFLATQNTEFIIPVYQRNYAWEKVHCKKLLDDIKELTNSSKSHFLGTITYILHIKESGFSMEREFVIIDGQQRITSIMLLLKAIDTLTKDEKIKNTIKNFIHLGEQNKLRLKPIINDREALRYVMEGRADKFSEDCKIIQNYKFFLNELRKMLKEGLSLDRICATFQRLNIVAIGLEKDRGDDDPQAVFESINATGLHLEGVDLIRNFLMMNDNLAEQERLFDEYWARIEDTLVKKEESIIDFIEKYLRIYYGSKIRVGSSELIYHHFKELTRDYFQDDREKIMQDLLKFVKFYKIVATENGDLNDVNASLREKKELLTKMKFIRMLKFGVAYPFIMRLCDDFFSQRLDFANFYGILNVLISYFVRRAICRVESNALNDVMYDLYKKLENESEDNSYNINLNSLMQNLGHRTGSQLFPNNVYVERHFGDVNAYGLKAICPLVFYEIEALNNKELIDTMPPQSLSVEHFYPKTSTKEWQELVGEDYNKLEQYHINTFGNLTLINKDSNSRLSNKPFNEKIRILEDNSTLNLNRYFQRVDTWNIDEIQRRSQWLYEKFTQVDAFRDLPENARSQMEIITLQSEWEFLVPSLIIFPNGEKTRLKFIRDIPKVVIEYMQKHHSNEFYELLSRSYFDFIKEPSEIKKMQENNERIDVDLDFEEFHFVETHANSNRIQNSLLKLVDGLNLDPNKFEIKGYYKNS